MNRFLLPPSYSFPSLSLFRNFVLIEKEISAFRMGDFESDFLFFFFFFASLFPSSVYTREVLLIERSIWIDRYVSFEIYFDSLFMEDVLIFG